MIKAMVTDIDGVITDGKLYLADGKSEQKTINLKDVDCISQIRGQGLLFGMITGERDCFTEYCRDKFKPDFIFEGCKNKKEALEKICKTYSLSLEEICYIGDGKYDLEAVRSAGMGLCPANAVEGVKSSADYILKSEGGTGCLSEAFACVRRKNQGNGHADINILPIFEEHAGLLDQMISDREIMDSLEKCICLLAEVFRNGGKLLLCGNGGSAADAQHLATEFVSRFYMERKALDAEALTVNTSVLTAISNDYEYNKVFERQLEAKGKPGDALLAITTSGSSSNIIGAVNKAKEIGMYVILLTGRKRNTDIQKADVRIAVPSADTPRIQEMHILVGHILCEFVENLLFGDENMTIHTQAPERTL